MVTLCLCPSVTTRDKRSRDSNQEWGSGLRAHSNPTQGHTTQLTAGTFYHRMGRPEHLLPEGLWPLGRPQSPGSPCLLFLENRTEGTSGNYCTYWLSSEQTSGRCFLQVAWVRACTKPFPDKSPVLLESHADSIGLDILELSHVATEHLKCALSKFRHDLKYKIHTGFQRHIFKMWNNSPVTFYVDNI